MYARFLVSFSHISDWLNMKGISIVIKVLMIIVLVYLAILIVVLVKDTTVKFIILSLVALLMGLYFYNLSKKRSGSTDLLSTDNQEVITLEKLKNRIKQVEGFVEGFLERAQYFKALLSVGIVQAPDSSILLCKLNQGEFKGQWGFPAGYLNPDNEEEYTFPDHKAMFEVEKYTGITMEDLLYTNCLANDKPIRIRYSNPGYVEAKVYLFRLKNNQKVLNNNCRFVSIDVLRNLDVENTMTIGVWAYDIIEQCNLVDFDDQAVERINEMIKVRAVELNNSKTETIKELKKRVN